MNCGEGCGTGVSLVSAVLQVMLAKMVGSNNGLQVGRFGTSDRLVVAVVNFALVLLVPILDPKLDDGLTSNACIASSHSSYGHRVGQDRSL